jgi:Fe2+ transport system protein FeoA
VPGVATILGGIILLASASRPVAMVGAWLAAVAGAWFALGTVLSPIWPAASTLNPGSPAGATTLIRQLEHLGFFTGLGVVIVFVAALALGRLMVVGVRDRELALGREAAAAEPDSLGGDTTTVGTTTASTTRPGRGSLHSFGRWLVARRS